MIQLLALKSIGGSILNFLKDYWKELLITVAVAFILYKVYDSGYDRGVAKVTAKYDRAVKEAEKQSREKEKELENKVQSLEASLVAIDEKIKGKLNEEKTISNGIVGKLSKRLRDCQSSSGSAQTGSTTDGTSELANYAAVAEYNFEAALKNYKQVTGLQDYSLNLYKTCGGEQTAKIKQAEQSVRQRLEELKQLSKGN